LPFIWVRPLCSSKKHPISGAHGNSRLSHPQFWRCACNPGDLDDFESAEPRSSFVPLLPVPCKLASRWAIDLWFVLEVFASFQLTSSNTIPGELEGSCSRYLPRPIPLSSKATAMSVWCAHCYSSEDDWIVTPYTEFTRCWQTL
jgi:hypothetical protein